MTDLQCAVEHLEGHTICLCKDENYITHDGRGISPMMQLISEKKDLKGWSVADVIIGKAAAMLFVKAGIRAVFGKVMSKAAKEFLEIHGVICEYETLTERIINRAGTGMCPMEQTVADIDDAEIGYSALYRKLAEMRKNGT